MPSSGPRPLQVSGRATGPGPCGAGGGVRSTS
eukprot:CAMPEP_0115856614 /NCGR_PEP_ID=MMETSP0287-20121206/15146_1 /TAXON_ID=412157 /ORGANISM="Chrysochromulina rotalis, Strain UIO044" /LENGTH=31 /DNA_ID= /DNA_START= /DNA_END= /DNA_ORIENTATION=